MGAATNSPIAIIQLPNSADSATNPLSLQRYYYKADLVILETNITTTFSGTNYSNVLTSVIFKNPMFDGSPLIFNYTNNLPTNTGALYTNWVRMNTNWAWWGVSNWLTTNATFYDARQAMTNRVTQIDVAKFGSWIATNTNAIAKWNSTTPFNGIVYMANLCNTNTMYMNAVRLTNGQVIPTIGASNLVGGLGSNYAYTIPGFSVGTLNPLYISGLYNCPSTSVNVSSTNTTGCQPCSVVCDALTILSPNWTDGNSWAEATSGSSAMPTASTADTVNCAIIAGNVPSTGSSATQFSGGVHNLTRLLEDWGSSTLWLNTSIINLYGSAYATKQFQSPGIYYDAPTRKFSFDLNYTRSTGLPPGTPQVNRMIRATWWSPPPNNITHNPSPTLEFVPQ